MVRPLRSTLAAFAAVAVATSMLLFPGASQAADATSRAGGCTGTEGVTVVLDMNPTSNSSPAAPVRVRCVFGTPGNGIDALERAGFDVETSDAFGDPFVCVIDGLPAACDPFGSGYWSYWKQQGAGWTFYDVGGFLARPKPGDVEGWRWVGDWATDPSVAPRVAPHAVQVTDGPSAAVAAGTNATFTFAVPDAPTTRTICRLDAEPWATCTSATTHVVSASTHGTHTLTVRAEDTWGNVTLATRDFAVATAAASLGSAASNVTGPSAATLSSTLTPGGAAQQVHAEFTSGTDRAAASRTASITVPAGSGSVPVSFAVDGLASNTTFAFRIVSAGAAGTEATDWATFSTPRRATRLDATMQDRFVTRGTRAIVEVERLDAGEPVSVRLGTTAIGSAVAGTDGAARVRVTIPADAGLGSARLEVVGSTSDRIDRVSAIVTTKARLRVATTASRVRAGGAMRVVVSGLVAREPVTVRLRGVVVANGVASARGRYVALVRVGARPGRVVVRATGSHASRAGMRRVTVVRSILRRRG